MSSTPQSPARADVSGRLLFADGGPAAAVPYELEAEGESAVGTTDAQGGFAAAALLPAGAAAVNLRLLDGFGAGLVGDRDGLGAPTLVVPHIGGGRLEDAYLLAVPKAMAVVSLPDPASAAATKAVTALDLIGTHGDGELITQLSPAQIAELRALKIEVLVLDVDANRYAAQTGSMSDDERVRHVDARMRAARTELARVTETGPAPR